MSCHLSSPKPGHTPSRVGAAQRTVGRRCHHGSDDIFDSIFGSEDRRRGGVLRSSGSKIEDGGDSLILEAEDRRLKMGGFFDLPAPKIVDGGGFLDITALKTEESPPSSMFEAEE